MTVSLHVWGDYACFTRPELKAERVSYEVMTPSAARGILTAIYWKPKFRWVVERIHVLNPILFTQIRRNELGCRMKVPSVKVMNGLEPDKLGFAIEDYRQQRSATILRDVSYIIDARVEVLHPESGVGSLKKHIEMFKRRASKGQCFHQPCMGVREFPAMFALVSDEHPAPPCKLPENQLNRHLGLMLHDLVYKDDPKGEVICAHTEKRQTATPHFFMADLANGIVHVPSLSQSLS